MNTAASLPWLRLLALGAAALAGTLAVSVLLGWHTHNDALLQWRPDWIAMVYNTALAFLLCAVGLAAATFNRSGILRACAATAALLALLNALEYVGLPGLDVDQLIVRHYLTVRTNYPGRMAPNTILCFLLASAALGVLSPTGRQQAAVAGLLGSVILAFGIVGCFGYLIDVPSYGWRSFIPMAVNTATGFAVVGGGLLALAWGAERDAGRTLPRWLPVPVGVGTLTAVVCLWQAILARPEKAHLLAGAALVGGCVMAFALALAVTLAQAAWRRAAQVRDAVLHLSSASRQILSSTEAQTGGVQQQAAAVSETVTTVHEITRTAEQAAQKARGVGAAVGRTVQIGQDGRRAVQESVEAMADVQKHMDAITAAVNELAEHARAIGRIISQANDFAEETNVLALNAAIEAARAGESARGFGVVAREVKALAGRSKGATADVRRILLDIQKATRQAVQAAAQGGLSVQTAARVIRRAGERIDGLAGTLEETGHSAEQIVASAGQHAAGMAQVNQAMQDIENVITGHAAAIRQVEQAARNLHTLSNQLAGLAVNGQAGHAGTGLRPEGDPI
jgi:methyl-accepting chemotaxis protein